MYFRRIAIFVGLLLGGQALAEQVNLESPNARISYAIGFDMARNLRKQGVEVDADLIARGLRDGMAGNEAPMSEKELRKVMNDFQSDVRQKMAQNRRLAADDNRKRGVAFMEQNKNREGVVVLPSGVQYRVEKMGDGSRPAESDIVLCNYSGKLLNGHEFDATEAGKPATFKLAALIPGWREVLKLMPVGSKWQIAIPPQLAYGERGAGSEIGPNETLLFEVELVAIK